MPIDPEHQKQAKEYAHIGHRLFALELALTALALIAVLGLGLNVGLRQIILSFSSNVWLATGLYFVAALVAYGALFFPLTYHSGFALPHRSGLSVCRPHS